MFYKKNKTYCENVSTTRLMAQVTHIVSNLLAHLHSAFQNQNRPFITVHWNYDADSSHSSSSANVYSSSLIKRRNGFHLHSSRQLNSNSDSSDALIHQTYILMNINSLQRNQNMQVIVREEGTRRRNGTRILWESRVRSRRHCVE